jgi:hypothetical protein
VTDYRAAFASETEKASLHIHKGTVCCRYVPGSRDKKETDYRTTGVLGLCVCVCVCVCVLTLARKDQKGSPKRGERN